MEALSDKASDDARRRGLAGLVFAMSRKVALKNSRRFVNRRVASACYGNF